MTDRTSRLVDVLLESAFSGNSRRIPDSAIIAKAQSARRISVFTRFTAAAAAACIAAVIVFMALGKTETPQQSAEIPRKPDQTTTEQDNIILIGKHIRVTPSAEAVTYIPDNEPNVLFVEKGTVACSVDPGGKGFTVRSDAGEAVVTGTLFTVTVQSQPDPEPDTSIVQMDVSVDRGTVIVRDGLKEQQVRAGQKTRIQARIRRQQRIRKQKGKQAHGQLSGDSGKAAAEEPVKTANEPENPAPDNKPAVTSAKEPDPELNREHNPLRTPGARTPRTPRTRNRRTGR